MTKIIQFESAAARKKATARKNYQFKTDISLDDALNCLYRFLLAMKLIQSEEEFIDYNFIYQAKIRAFLWESGIKPEDKGGVSK